MILLSTEQKTIHERAMRLADQHRQIEAELIRVLQEVDRTKLFKKLNQPSLFMYATQILGLSESVAYAFISVSRKSKEIPELQEAIDQTRISVSKASRIISAMKIENAGTLI